MKAKTSTTRKYVLLTLTHADMRPEIQKHHVTDRIRGVFESRAIVVVKESHEESGDHFHAGLIAKDASKHTATKKMRAGFPEREGRTRDVKFHKGWGTVCAYVMKKDEEPCIWRQYNIDQFKEIALARNRGNQS